MESYVPMTETVIRERMSAFSDIWQACVPNPASINKPFGEVRRG